SGVAGGGRRDRGQLHREGSRGEYRQTGSGRTRGRLRGLVERFSIEMSIDDWREKIDEIDRKLVELLNERSRCAIEVGRLKRSLNMRVYDPDREQEIFRRVRQENNGPLDNASLQRLFERVIDECRRIERKEAER